MTPFAFVFPGQGSQAVGMLDAWGDHPVVRQTLAEAADALGVDIGALIHAGPKEQLDLTTNTQPVMLTAGIACYRAWVADTGLLPDVVAGHSLGEYSALCAAGAISVADAARLLRLRGRAMQAAVPVGVGAMAALLGLDFATASEVAQEAAQGEVCQAANDNDPAQVVVSGHRAAVERALEIAKARGAKRAVLLPVSAPFHCALMEPAARAMAEALDAVDIKAPAVPVVANVRARAVSDPAVIRSLLVEQVTGSVRWRESVAWMGAQGVDEFWEIGAGKALSGMIRRIAKDAETRAVGTPEDVAAAKG